MTILGKRTKEGNVFISVRIINSSILLMKPVIFALSITSMLNLPIIVQTDVQVTSFLPITNAKIALIFGNMFSLKINVWIDVKMESLIIGIMMTI